MSDAATIILTLEEWMTGAPAEWDQFQDGVNHEYAGDHPENLTINFGPDSFGEHELLDRIYCATELLHHLILPHSALSFHPQAYRYLYLAVGALVEAYQVVGADSGPTNQAVPDSGLPTGLREEVPEQKEGEVGGSDAGEHSFPRHVPGGEADGQRSD